LINNRGFKPSNVRSKAKKAFKGKGIKVKKEAKVVPIKLDTSNTTSMFEKIDLEANLDNLDVDSLNLDDLDLDPEDLAEIEALDEELDEDKEGEDEGNSTKPTNETAEAETVEPV
jgi:hypothetical protein